MLYDARVGTRQQHPLAAPHPSARPAWSGAQLHVHPCAAGVYVAHPAVMGWAGANAAIVDLGDRTVLVDAGPTQAAGRELAAAAHALTGRDVSAVVHTHHHSDHLWGNGGVVAAAGREVELIAAAGVRQMLLTDDEAASVRTQTPAEIARLDARIARAAADDEHRRLEEERTFHRTTLAEAGRLDLRLPTLTFDRRLRLFGRVRTLEAICYGGGHTRSDTIAWVPEAGVLITGDLVTVEAHPYLAEGDALEWLHLLRALQTHQPQTVIPGHGPAAGPEAIETMIDYIEQMLELAEGAPTDEEGYEDAETEEWLQDVLPPEACAAWAFDSFFGRNLRHEVRRLSRGPRSP